MNKEKEALLKAILAQPDVPRKIAPKNVLRFVDRMKPETEAMRDYLMAIFSSETDISIPAFSVRSNGCIRRNRFPGFLYRAGIFLPVWDTS